MLYASSLPGAPPKLNILYFFGLVLVILQHDNVVECGIESTVKHFGAIARIL